MERLHYELNMWKPKTVWELRYSGYGSIDPVGRYAFYFGTLLGIATIIRLCATVAHTYAAFKSLHPLSGES